MAWLNFTPNSWRLDGLAFFMYVMFIFNFSSKPFFVLSILQKLRTSCSFCIHVHIRVGNFRQKKYFAEDGIDGTIGLFRRNSGCSAEQKILGIPFRTVPQRRKMLGILHHGTKLEANARNSVLYHSAEEKTTRNLVPRNKNISNSVPNHSAEETTTRNSIPKHLSEKDFL